MNHHQVVLFICMFLILVAAAAAWGGEAQKFSHQEMMKIQDRLLDAIWDHPVVGQHLVFSAPDFNERGERVFRVGVRPGWLEEAKRLLPQEYEGIPVEFIEMGPDFPRMKVRSWYGDEKNPRRQELRKMQSPLEDFLTTKLEPGKQLVTLGLRLDGNGNPCFEVGLMPGCLEEAEKRLPQEFEGIPVKYVVSGPLKFPKKQM